MPVAAARLITPRDQPKAWPPGTISTPGVERRPAAASSATKISATTASAVWRPNKVLERIPRDSYHKSRAFRPALRASRPPDRFALAMTQQEANAKATQTYSAWADAFSPAELDRIEAYGESLAPDAAVVLSDNVEGDVRQKIRITQTAWLPQNAQT